MSNILFPINARRVKWDPTVEQDWDVNEQTSASGKSRTMTNQSLPGWVFTITFPALSSEERNKLFAFFTRAFPYCAIASSPYFSCVAGTRPNLIWFSTKNFFRLFKTALSV